MKRILTLLGSIVIFLAVLSACKKNDNPYGIIRTTVGNPQATYHETYMTKDGYTIIETLGFSPMNTFMTILDPQDRTVVEAGQASEAMYFNFVRYFYDTDNTLTGLLSFPKVGIEGEEDKSMQIFCNEFEEEEMELNPASLFKISLDTKENKPYFSRFNFKYNQMGQMVAVYDPETKQAMQALPGYHIQYEVTQSDNFWESDLDGGKMVVRFKVAPIEKKTDLYTTWTYCGYALQMEEQYSHTSLISRAIYRPNDSSPYKKVSLTKKGKQMVYIIEQADDKDYNSYRFTWENGILKKEEGLSEYGTVLKRTVYYLSKDNKNYIAATQQYNYITKRLELVREERIETNKFLEQHVESDMMDMKDEVWKLWQKHY